jgi:hypothetical protein
MRISVLVKPGRSRESVILVSETDYIVHLTARPQRGEANEALIRLLAEHFSVPRSGIRITTGRSGRRKIVDLGT